MYLLDHLERSAIFINCTIHNFNKLDFRIQNIFLSNSPSLGNNLKKTVCVFYALSAYFLNLILRLQLMFHSCSLESVNNSRPHIQLLAF